MKTVVLIYGLMLTLPLSTCTEHESQTSTETELEQRIVNGIMARQGESPWMVSLNILNRFTCSASIISQTSVLTSAHCVFDTNGQILYSSILTIGAGSIYRPSTRFTYGVSRVIPHPKYDPQSQMDGRNGENDIAILKVKRPFHFNRDVDSICVNGLKWVPLRDQLVTSIGWGQQEYCMTMFSNPSNILLYAPLRVVSIENNQIYTKGYYGTKICKGDSGGPLVAYFGEEKPMVIGIASRADKKRKLDIFTEISPHKYFIQYFVKENVIC